MSPLTDEERTNLRGSLRVLRIIVFALMMGVTTFTGYSVFTQMQKGLPQPAFPAAIQMTHALALAAAAVAAVIAFVVPPFIPVPKIETNETDPRQIAIGQAAGTLQTRTIIACAVLEGAAFFNAIWVQMDGSVPNLAMVGVLLIILALHFPLAGWYFGKVERLMGVDPFESSYALTRD